MSYRFVRITNYYPQYLKNFYQKNRGIESKSYSEQYNCIINDSFETASCYTKNLNKAGVNAFDIISNAQQLQSAWTSENELENGIIKPETISHQLKQFKPDVVWVDDFSFINAGWKAEIERLVPSIKLWVGHICAPYNSEMEEKFRMFDLMFTCTPCFKNQLEKLGIKAHLLYHGFEKEVLSNIHVNNRFPVSGFLFSGSLYTGSGFHMSRINYIEKLLDAGIHMDLYCNLESWTKVMAKKSVYNIFRTARALNVERLIDRIPVLKKKKSYGDSPVKYYSKKLIASTKPPVFGYDMYQLLSKAKVCFNIHGEVAQKCAGNIRLFEATGVGTCLVTDWKENICDLFEPEKEIVTYKSVEECIEKVRWLMNHPAEREKIAKAGQRRTLAEHTVENRARLINEIIKKELL